ncbi:unnamed protein product [Cuscuta epithymum]|nr:unnamed protein product [Cuscuta epithymum]CAH9142364.1 unnamed protein product [Cuscuta epithymum]
MQQYFSVAEVVYALQQVESRKQRRGFDNGGFKGRRTGGGGRGYWRNEGLRESGCQNYVAEAISNKDSKANGIEKSDGADKELEMKQADKKEYSERSESNILMMSLGNSQSDDLQSEANKDDKCTAKSDGSCGVENECNSTQVPHGKQNHTITPKTFVGKEFCDGKMVNVVDGLKLYEELLSDSEVSKLLSMVNELRVAGKSGQLQGQTFVVSKRPMKGHGREMIQLGIPVTDVTENEAAAGISKEKKVDTIPVLLQEVIDSLASKQVVPIKPDSCMIDIFNEGDYSQPNMWPLWFGRPISVLFLTECDITYGKMIDSHNRGEYRGSLRLSLAPGSMLVMQGKSADFAKHAIPSLQKQRIILTLTKSQLDKTAASGNSPRGPTYTGPLSPHTQYHPPSKPPNHIIRPSAPKHYNGPVVSTSCVILPPGPAACPQLLPSNGVQPMFVSTPVPPPQLPFPSPPVASAGWNATPAPTNPPPPRLPVSGTGVFFPPSSGNSPNQSLVVSTTPSATDSALEEDTFPPSEKYSGGPEALNHEDGSTPEGKVEVDVEVQEKVEELLNGNTENSHVGEDQ